jgi:hypothetical protein
MEYTVLIPHTEIREEDLTIGVRVHVEWDPYDSKPDAIGTITEVRRWPKSYCRQGESPDDIIIHVVDERTGAHREASLEDQWIDIITPI